ncbi:hypothetical protein [uncultured Cohaesibacter sp.]|uniref:hypothetical protein n=1 Tax=uncultured Cohaesibacter sp. TaxID=1002546 RepID=UPI002931059E|nr:hypothetical protein [uncultured Cohaesibacter sp.]
MAYILYHLELVWSFVRGDDEALYRIDSTPRGVVLSFLAMIIVEPLSLFYAFLLGFLDKVLFFRDGGLPYYFLQLLLDWGLAPLVLYLFCILFGFRDRIIPLIVSYNWLSVIVLMITILPGALMTSQLVAAPMAVLLMLAIYGFALWIAFRLYRFVLACPASMAVGLAVLMLIIGISSAVWLQDLVSNSLGA